MKTNTLKSTAVTGCAVFALFFGSGNLVFPLALGAATAGSFGAALAGFSITAVLVPLMGLIAMSLFQASPQAFFAPLGKTLTWLICLFSLALMGPCGVAPRCALVAHGAVSLVFPSLPLWVFSFLFCAAIGLLLINRSRMLDFVGKWLTPVLLAGVAVVFGVAFFHGSDTAAVSCGLTSSEAFWTGLKQGYQMMDLLAALFFAGLILNHVQQQFSCEKATLRALVSSSLVGMGLMMLIYTGMLYLGGQHADMLSEATPDKHFALIAGHHLGPWAAPCVAVVFVLACLTTAVALVDLFAEFLRTQMPFRLNRPVSLLISLGMTFALSLVGFSTLMGFLGAVLEYVYPALMALTVANLVSRLSQHNLVRWSFWLTLAGCIMFACAQ